MRGLLLAGMVLLQGVLQGSAGAGQAPAGLEKLGWMAGCWRTAGNEVTEEHWMAPSGGTMIGMSRTVRGGRTTGYEFLQIRAVDGVLTYVARPSGQAETPFPMKSIGDGEVLFENPTHDFPQRIGYRKTPAGVTARVEGTANGQVQGFDIAFTQCTP